MIAILTENYGGKWPFWLAPRQVVVIPISPENNAYASTVQKKLHAAGLYAEADFSNNQLKKKIRNAEIAHINYTLVVGAQEEANNAVNVRARDNSETKQRGEIKALDDVISELVALKTSRS